MSHRGTKELFNRLRVESPHLKELINSSLHKPNEESTSNKRSNTRLPDLMLH